ncbi:uncharacterized protein [Penaeus vannamei]|uniref:uncharacterized protein n=1 Tax=Penaeus vannamei TaxID=6689 RepID=UPI00387F737B
MDATDAYHVVCLTGDQDLHCSQVCRTRSLFGRDKEKFIWSLAEEVEGQALRKLYSKPSSQVTAIRLVNGQIISDPFAVWERYFEQLYQVDPPIVNLDAGNAEVPLLDPPISEDPLSLTKAKEAISKLRSIKAAGISSIPAELLKTCGEPMVQRLHTVLDTIPYPLTC